VIATALTIARRELAAFFYSPIAYAIATLMLGVNGAMFVIALNAFDGDLGQSVPILYGWLVYWFVSVLVPPLLTMRLFSEEKRSGTIETLMTAPVSDAGVVFGKYLAVLGYYAVLWLPTLSYFVVVRLLGGNPDLGLFVSCLLGTVLCGALFLAIGLFTSACTSNQVLAASSALVINLVLFFLPLAAYAMAKAETREFLERYALMNIFQSSFLNGVVDTAHVVYLVSLAGFFLFLTVRVVEARKWR
jgi:ABC-2 type transport system permease protein